MRKEIDSIKVNVDYILETMLAMAIREKEFCNIDATRNEVVDQGCTSHSRLAVHVPNPVVYRLPSGYTPPFEGVATQPGQAFMVIDGVTAQGMFVVN